jgi:hypothetical protein
MGTLAPMGASINEQPGTLLESSGLILSHYHYLHGRPNFTVNTVKNHDRPGLQRLWSWIRELLSSARAGLEPRWTLDTIDQTDYLFNLPMEAPLSNIAVPLSSENIVRSDSTWMGSCNWADREDIAAQGLRPLK